MIAIAAGEDDVGTGLRKSAGEILAETAAGSSHDGYAAAEIKKIVCHRSSVMEVSSHGSVFTKRFRE